VVYASRGTNANEFSACTHLRFWWCRLASSRQQLRQNIAKLGMTPLLNTKRQF